MILRPGTFFGPGDRLHFGRMAQKVKDGKGLIIGKGDNALPFCYVTDVVQGFLLGAMMFGSDNRHSVGKARRELGYEPKVDLREGIKLAAEWFNTGGMQQPSVTQASQHAPLAGAIR